MITNKKLQRIRKEQEDANRFWKKEIEKERDEYYKDKASYIRKAEVQNNEIKNFLKKLNLSRKKENSVKIIRIKLSEKFSKEIGDSVPIKWILEYKPERIKR